MSMRKYKALSREIAEFLKLHEIKLTPEDVIISNRIIHADPLRCRIERKVTLSFTEEITDKKEIERIIHNTPIHARSQ